MEIIAGILDTIGDGISGVLNVADDVIDFVSDNLSKALLITVAIGGLTMVAAPTIVVAAGLLSTASTGSAISTLFGQH